MATPQGEVRGGGGGNLPQMPHPGSAIVYGRIVVPSLAGIQYTDKALSRHTVCRAAQEAGA